MCYELFPSSKFTINLFPRVAVHSIIEPATNRRILGEETMDNTLKKIGVIDYKKSKYSHFFIIGSFIFFIIVGGIFIALSNSISSNILMGQWFLLGCLCYIVLHEIIHLLFMKFFSKESLYLSIKFPTISVGSKGKFSKRQFIIVALAPVIILGIVLTLLIVFCSEGYTFFLSQFDFVFPAIGQ